MENTSTQYNIISDNKNAQTNLEISHVLEFPNSFPNISETQWATITINGSSLNRTSPIMDYVMVIDKSGSMKADNKMAYVQATLEYFVRNLEEKNRFAVITFNAD